LNFTPNSTEAESDSLAFAGVAVDGQIVHAVQPTETGVTALDGGDAGPVPTALLAVTVNVYEVPFVSPDTFALVAGGFPVTLTGLCAVVPTNGVTVYLVIALPPSEGTDQLTTAFAWPGVAVTLVGASGAVGGVVLGAKVTSTQKLRALVLLVGNALVVVVMNTPFPVLPEFRRAWSGGLSTRL
jgi:hypothetical protein